MPKTRVSLSVAFLCLTLLLIVFYAGNLFGGPIGFFFRNVRGLNEARLTGQIAAFLASAGILVAGLAVTVPPISRQTGLARKLAAGIPSFFLLFTLAGAIAAYAGIGTVGNLAQSPPLMSFTFSSAWIGIGAVAGAIALTIAAARTQLSPGIQRLTGLAMTATTALSTLTWIATAAAVVILSTNQPSLPNFGGPGGPGGQPGQGGPGGPGQPGGPPNQQPGGQPGGPGQPPQGGQPGGRPGQQQQPGGPAPSGQPPAQTVPGLPNVAALVSQQQIAAGIMTVLLPLGFAGALSFFKNTRIAPPSGSESAAGSRAPLGQIALVWTVLAAILLVAIQLPPVNRSSPPVETAIAWDSPQTRTLIVTACLDCHSNETRWPWYSAIAPASWLTVIHVNDGRNGFNLSELDRMPAARRAQLPENMAMRVRNGTMPPRDYLLNHPDARLSDAQKDQLIQGIRASIGVPGATGTGVTPR